jgi:hypothetical protein
MRHACRRAAGKRGDRPGFDACSGTPAHMKSSRQSLVERDAIQLLP